MSTSPSLTLLQPGRIGGVEIRNRFIRSATSETMADENGFITQAYRDLHLELARSGVGLIFTGHCYVQRRGRYEVGMTGLDRDDHIGALQSHTRAIQGEGAKIFAQLNHAGSQSRDPELAPLAPSAVPNAQHGRTPAEATEEEIVEIVQAFGQAARRVKKAGFDGVHLHAGHGYLITEFLSPFANRRRDRWGGPLENRQRFLKEVVLAMRTAVGDDFPLTVKLGMRDFVPGGFTVEEGLATAVLLDGLGVDAVEVTAGLTSAAMESAVRYTGVDRRRALEDKLFHRVLAKPKPEAYFRQEAHQLRQMVKCPIILVGGLRTVETMEAVVAEGTVDFVSLARPFIREPDLVREIEQGRRGLVACTSCNICIDHEGLHPLKCWRKNNKDLLIHAWYRFTRQLH